MTLRLQMDGTHGGTGAGGMIGSSLIRLCVCTADLEIPQGRLGHCSCAKEILIGVVYAVMYFLAS